MAVVRAFLAPRWVSPINGEQIIELVNLSAEVDLRFEPRARLVTADDPDEDLGEVVLAASALGPITFVAARADSAVDELELNPDDLAAALAEMSGRTPPNRASVFAVVANWLDDFFLARDGERGVEPAVVIDRHERGRPEPAPLTNRRLPDRLHRALAGLTASQIATASSDLSSNAAMLNIATTLARGTALMEARDASGGLDLELDTNEDLAARLRTDLDRSLGLRGGQSAGESRQTRANALGYAISLGKRLTMDFARSSRMDALHNNDLAQQLESETAFEGLLEFRQRNPRIGRKAGVNALSDGEFAASLIRAWWSYVSVAWAISEEVSDAISADSGRADSGSGVSIQVASRAENDYLATAASPSKRALTALMGGAEWSLDLDGAPTDDPPEVEIRLISADLPHLVAWQVGDLLILAEVIDRSLPFDRNVVSFKNLRISQIAPADLQQTGGELAARAAASDGDSQAHNDDVEIRSASATVPAEPPNPDALHASSSLAVSPASSVNSDDTLELTDVADLSEDHRAALARSAEVVLGPVRIHLSNGSWSTESGFDFGVSEEVARTAEFLESELRRLTDEPPDEVLVARLLTRLDRALLDLLAKTTEADAEVLEQLKAVVIDEIAQIDGVDDFKDIIAAADKLAFAAHWNREAPEGVDQEQWERFVGDGSDPARIFGRFMSWAIDTDLTWQNASRATSLVVAAVTGGIGFASSSGAVAGVVGGVGAIATALVSSTVWFLRARLQPKAQDLMVPEGQSHW